jgi:S-adenosyl methyltransferase
VTGYLRWVPPRIDMSLPHPDRMQDYWLGGGHNFAADRELAEKIKQVLPGIEDVARLKHAFLRRAALFMIEAGIRQFLRFGSGIPSVGRLHEVIQQAAPGSRIVNVDADPVAVAHSELMLEGSTGIAVLQADMRDVPGILTAEPIQRLLDLTRPVGLIAPMLHFMPDAWEPAAIIAEFRDRLPSGSYLAIAHVTQDAEPPGLARAVEATRSTSYPLYPRSRTEILRLCAGFELVDPGLVGFARWRPDDLDGSSTRPGINALMYAGVGRRR